MSVHGGPSQPVGSPPDGAWPDAAASEGSVLAPLLVRSWIAPALGYVAALVVTVGFVVLALVAALFDDLGTDSFAPGVSDASAVLMPLLLPLHLAAMALGGRLHLTGDQVFGGVVTLPLLATAAFLAVVFLVAARSERRRPTGSRGSRAIISVIGAASFALALNLLLWALALRWDGSSLHAASGTLFVGALVLGSTADFLGRSRGAGDRLPLAPLWRAGVVTWLISLGLWLALALPVMLLLSVFLGGATLALLFPAWGPSAALMAYLAGHQAPWSSAGHQDWIWSESWPAALILLAAAVVLTVLTAVTWHLRVRRSSEELSQPSSWATLPVIHAVGSAVLILLTVVSVSGGFLGFGGSINVHAALWTPALLAAWGLLAEGLARTVAPGVAGLLPTRFVALLTRGAAADGDDTDTRVAEPRTPEQRRRDRKVVIAVGGAFAAVLVLAGGFQVVKSALFGPEAAIEAYLDAVVDKDVDEVRELTGELDAEEGSDALFTQEVYDKATSTITGYEIKDVTTLGSTVLAELELEGIDAEKSETNIEVVQDGSRWGIFPRWRVEAPGLANTPTLLLRSDTASVSINGVTADVSEDASDFWLLPGTYELDPFGGNPWVESVAEEMVVNPGGVFSLDWPEMPDFQDPQPSEQASEVIEAELTAYLEECASRGELEPADCPFDAYAYGETRNVEWEIVEAPRLDYGYDGQFPAEVSFRDGVAEVTYEHDDSYGFGPKEWTKETETTDIYLSATIDVEDDQLVVAFDSW